MPREGVPKNLTPENRPEVISKKRLGGPLVGKPIRGANGKWFNQFGEEVPASEILESASSPKDEEGTTGQKIEVIVPPPRKGPKRPGGPLQERPFLGPDGKWYGYK